MSEAHQQLTAMLRPELAGRIEEIALDRAGGAAELALRAAAVLAEAGQGELEEAAAAVKRAQPAMASVWNAAQAALAGTLAGFVEEMRSGQERINRIARELFGSRCVLTHSRSSTVIAALRAARPARIICTESLPGGEGRWTAADLEGELIPDTLVWRNLAQVDAVAVGADAVTEDTVVNKVGTALIALAARERGIPAYVLCGREKVVVDEGWQPEFGDLFEAIPRNWFTLPGS